MLGSKLSFNTARLGVFCAALALVVFAVGCPGPNPPGNACSGNPCDDMDPCTTDECTVDADATDGRVCTNTAVECTDGVCDPADGECVDCLTDADCDPGFCAQAPEGNACVTCILDTQCDDGIFCTDDVCENATCVNTNNTLDCDDENDCTDGDVCADGQCSGDPVAGDCDDGDICTAGDTCNSGVCVPGTDVPDCCETDADCVGAPGDLCVDNECITLTPDCVTAADCDDDDNCTDDACVDLVCVFVDKPCIGAEFCNPLTGDCVECLENFDCDDAIGCTVDACTGNTCANIPTHELCDDNLFCTGDGTETCDPDDPDANVVGCVSVGDPCKDGTIAVGKICNEAGNSCDDCANDAECDDDLPCTDDTCIAGTCDNDPDDANCPDPDDCDGVDICDPGDADADADGCVQPGNPCEDGTDATNKLCEEGTYTPGDGNTCTDCEGNADCDDGLACTNDSCNGITGECDRAPDDDLCPDSLFCDGVDLCAPGDPDADADGCIHDLPAYPCATACNEGTDACFDCEANADCDDNVDCTDDSCNGLTGDCTHTDNCPGLEVCNYQSGECE